MFAHVAINVLWHLGSTSMCVVLWGDSSQVPGAVPATSWGSWGREGGVQSANRDNVKKETFREI